MNTFSETADNDTSLGGGVLRHEKTRHNRWLSCQKATTDHAMVEQWVNENLDNLLLLLQNEWGREDTDTYSLQEGDGYLQGTRFWHIISYNKCWEFNFI